MKRVNLASLSLMSFLLSVFLGMFSVNSIIIGILGAYSGFYIYRRRNDMSLNSHHRVYIGICVFYILMFLIDYFFISKLGDRSFALMTRAFLILPLILISIYFNHIFQKKSNGLLFNIYIPLSIIPLVLLFYKIEGDYSLNSITNNLIIHRPYLGFMLATSIFMLAYHFVNTKLNNKRFILGFVITTLLFCCIFIQAKMTLISIGLTFTIWMFFFWKSKKKRYVLLVISTGLFMLMTYVKVYNSEEINKVFASLIYGENLEFNHGSPLKVGENSFNLRIITWKHSLKEIKESIWFGIGSDDAQIGLDNYYSKLGYPWMINMNTHNQYMDQWLTKGICGFASLLLLFAYPVYISIKTNNYLLFCFNVFFVFCCLTENMLSRQFGIVLYIFINSYFIFSTVNLNEEATI